MKKIQKIIIIYILLFSSIGMANHSENLQRLKDLYDDNILTEDQYNEAREKVLQQMEINNLDVANNDSPDTSDINKISPLEADEALQDYQFNKETWLSNYELKPKDLSPMLLELTKKTQATVPECTTDFCFTTQAEYATDEIINKGALINALYRQHPDYKIEPNWQYQQSSYCSEKKGCYVFQKDYTWEIKKENNTKVITARWYPTELFPEKEIDPNCKTVDPEASCFNREVPRQITQGTELMGLFTPDVWLEENGLTVEDVINMLKDYPTTYKIDRNTAIEGKGGMVSIPLKAKYSYTDEIVNTEQLIKSLLYWNPYLFGPDVGHRWNYERRPDGECTRYVYDPKDYEKAGCIKDIIVVNLPKECLGDNPPFYCMLDAGELPPLPDPPVDPPIRPGWKILEGTDMLVINDDDPYWQTEEGLIERPPKIDPGIEYPPETLPGADPKIVPDLTPEQDKPPSDPNAPPKLADPSILQPVDPVIEGDPIESLPDDPTIASLPGEGHQEPDACVGDANNPCPEGDVETPSKLDDPSVLQPIDPTVATTEQKRIDAEILRRASEGDFSNYVKTKLAGAASRLGVTAPKEEDFSQSYQGGQIYQTGSSVDPDCGTPPCDPNPPPKIDTGIEYAPETVPGADPKIVPDLTPEQDKPPSDPNPPPILADPTVLQPVDPG